MRTTLTLDADVAALVRKVMRARGRSFKEVVNEAIRRGLAAPERGGPYQTPTYKMGPARIPLDKALQLAAQMEDEELIRKMALRK